MLIGRLGLFGFLSLLFLPYLVLSLRHQLFQSALRNALLLRKLLGSPANEQDVWAYQHFACQRDGVFDALNTRYGSNVQPLTIHNASVQFDISIAIQTGSGARVITGVIFQRAHGGLNRVQRRTTLLEDAPSYKRGFFAASLHYLAALW